MENIEIAVCGIGGSEAGGAGVGPWNDCQSREIECRIERLCADLGLVVGFKATPRAFPGSTHWHFRRPSQSGTLEVTLYPTARRSWISIQDGRRADWIGAAAESLKTALEAAAPSRGLEAPTQ